MLPSETLTLSVPRNWIDLYETIWKPDFFPKWASGLSNAGLTQQGAHWVANGPDGKVKIRFTEHNPYGVMDHYIDTGAGREVYVPLRVVANGTGADIVITLFRQPLMSDEKFTADIDWVKRDLNQLLTLLTT